MQKIELLAPARDLACGLAAINCGADAVYIGAPQFGARAKAGNSLADIEQLVYYAHQYWARIYITLNTLLYDHELPEAIDLVHRLYQIGVDALIIQDVGLLEADLPPIPLIASTQMHNDSAAKVRFLEQAGFQRVILARELNREQIADIRRQTSVELEFFIHGALCVCFSGQCYLSYALGGRSGNRGDCAQPCRKLYRLTDATGKTIMDYRYALSLKDLNLSESLADLIDAGITSFKIEGRLKDLAYVTNVVSFYRQQLDAVLAAGNLARQSSGSVNFDFTPNVNKTFNRGYTTYFLHDPMNRPGSMTTPKMVGELLGTITAVSQNSIMLAGDVDLAAGDGICFFDDTGALQGTVINKVVSREFFPNNRNGLVKGRSLYRNYDHRFHSQVMKSRVVRKIDVTMTLTETASGVSLLVQDEDGNSAQTSLAMAKDAADNPELALATIQKQLMKTGNTIFRCDNVAINLPAVHFIPVATLNALRRSALEKLTEVRRANRPRLQRVQPSKEFLYPEKKLSYLGNVLNRSAEAFYRRHGVEEIEPAAESGLTMAGRRVMRTRYCILNQLGLCRRHTNPPLPEPLFLVDEEGRQLELRFDCAGCAMEIYFRSK